MGEGRSFNTAAMLMLVSRSACAGRDDALPAFTSCSTHAVLP